MAGHHRQVRVRESLGNETCKDCGGGKKFRWGKIWWARGCALKYSLGKAAITKLVNTFGEQLIKKTIKYVLTEALQSDWILNQDLCDPSKAGL